MRFNVFYCVQEIGTDKIERHETDYSKDELVVILALASTSNPRHVFWFADGDINHMFEAGTTYMFRQNQDKNFAKD